MTASRSSVWRSAPSIARAVAGAITVLLALIAGAPASAVAAPEIRWRVINPFRLFLEPADTEMHAEVFRRPRQVEQRQPIAHAERQLSEQYPWGWAERIYERLCWDDQRQSYVCAEYPNYGHPQAHRTHLELRGLDNPNSECIWSSSRSPNDRRTTACNQAITFDVPYPSGVTVTVHSHGRAIASTEIRVTDLLVVGLGDSYASGDGNPDRPVRFDDHRVASYGPPGPKNVSGYPARAGSWGKIGEPSFHRHDAGWHAESCHRSLYGHQLRVALQLSLEDPHRAVTFASFACWGSDSIDGLLLGREPSTLTPGLPRVSQATSVARLQCGPYRTVPKRWAHAFDISGALPRLADLDGEVCPPHLARKIDLLLVVVGGNDIGFANVVANAVLADASPLRSIGGWLGRVSGARQAQAALPELSARFKALNRAFHTVLHIPWSEPDRIVLTSYPPIALQENGVDACRTGREGLTVLPEFTLDQRRAHDSETVAAQLYSTMRKLAREHGWSFVDAHRIAFARHGLCAAAYGSIADPADEGRLPRLVDGVWRPYPPSQWHPYAPRRRWIRTPNDGYLTVHFHGPGLEPTPLNLLLAASYSGGFHPTAEGQAVIADAVADTARDVIARRRGNR